MSYLSGTNKVWSQRAGEGGCPTISDHRPASDDPRGDEAGRPTSPTKLPNHRTVMGSNPALHRLSMALWGLVVICLAFAGVVWWLLLQALP